MSAARTKRRDVPAGVIAIDRPVGNALRHAAAEQRVKIKVIHVDVADVAAADAARAGARREGGVEVGCVDVADRLPDEVAAPRRAVAVDRDRRVAGAAATTRAFHTWLFSSNSGSTAVSRSMSAGA
jgi:hypothetical protein